MSLRVASKPIPVPTGVDVKINGQQLEIKGAKGALTQVLHDAVGISHQDGVLQLSGNNDEPNTIALTGTMRSLVNNIIIGVSQGFERKLELKGVGYRAQAQGKNLNLTVGFSHPVVFPVPNGITIETPSQTEIVVKGTDKQLVGQVAANLRRVRPPDAYKGKGIRYADERISLKETKKK